MPSLSARMSVESRTSDESKLPVPLSLSGVLDTFRFLFITNKAFRKNRVTQFGKATEIGYRQMMVRKLEESTVILGLMSNKSSCRENVKYPRTQYFCC